MELAFVGLHSPRTDDYCITFVALQAKYLSNFRETCSEGEPFVVPASAFPGYPLPEPLETDAPRAVVLIGTSEGDEWATWHPPIPQPPVPKRSA